MAGYKSTFIVFCFVLIIFSSFKFIAIAQVTWIPFERYSGRFSSSKQNTMEAQLVKTDTLFVEDARLMRIKFSEVNLGMNSYLSIESPNKGYAQKLVSNSIRQWKNYTAVLPDNTLLVKLFVGSGDREVFYKMKELMVVKKVWQPVESVCGQDDRISFNHKAVGRIVFDYLSPPCTAWILPDGRLATAGHCIEDILNAQQPVVVEFNVPLSDTNGNMQPANPVDQYVINESLTTTQDYQNQGVGNDWGIFTVFPNSNTGLMPKKAQNEYFHIKREKNLSQLRIIGYGEDLEIGNKTKNHTQQQALGSSFSSSNDAILLYDVDTENGNSGSPVIDAKSGFVVGVHNEGGCLGGGKNKGTSFFQSSFWNSIGIVSVEVEQLLSDQQSRVGQIGHWNGSFFADSSFHHVFNFKIGSQQVLRADTNVYFDEKYHDWNGEPDVRNPHQFSITGDFPSRLVSQFWPTKFGIEIKNSFISLGNLDLGDDVVYFSDPWLRDSIDVAHGNFPINRGRYAKMKLRPSPFRPDLATSYNGDVYQGVFLDQNETFDPNLPIYSVRAQADTSFTFHGQSIPFHFVGWEGDNVQFQYPNQTETAVVFKQDGAEARALYK
ncbi:MAG: hypothetical protein D6813_14165, partial [Calditrichaeota bacterium]